MINKLEVAGIVSNRFLRLMKLVGLIGGWFVAGVLAPPRKKYPYYLRNTLVVQESENYCMQHKDSLKNFLRALYVAAGDEPGLVADAGQITRRTSKIENGDFTAEYQYIFVYMSADVIVFSLLLYLLEMYAVVSKEGGTTKDFFTFCEEFSRKNYFDNKDWAGITLGLIKRLSPSSDNVFDSQKYSSDKGAGVARAVAFIKRLCSNGDNIRMDVLQEKIEQELEAAKATTIKAYANIATIMQDKKRFLESSKTESAKLNVALLDYVLNKLLTFADAVYSLAVLHVHWMQAGLLAFIEDEEKIGESASFVFSTKRLEQEMKEAGNDCMDASERLLDLFEAEIVASYSSVGIVDSYSSVGT